MVLTTGLLCVILPPALASDPATVFPVLTSSLMAQATLQQGQQLYDAGRYREAIPVLEQVAGSTTDPAEAIVALRNLALVQLRLGEWGKAEAALDQAFEQLRAHPVLGNGQALTASLLDVQASVALDQGQAEAAIAHWDNAAAIYTDLNQPLAANQAQVNKAQAVSYTHL
ncbi:hypothetical protein C8B47_30845, partial [filamentous cyanobacterium CCP4]